MAESNCYAKGVYGFNSAIGPSDIMNVVVFLHRHLKTPRPSIECYNQTMSHLSSVHPSKRPSLHVNRPTYSSEDVTIPLERYYQF